MGLRPGEVVVTAEGNALRVEPVVEDSLESIDGLLVIPSAGVSLTAERVQNLRESDQR